MPRRSFSLRQWLRAADNRSSPELSPSSCCPIAAAFRAGWESKFELLHSGSLPTGIAAGPDGAVWFTERNGNRIGRISATGAITEFPTGLRPMLLVERDGP